MRKGFFCLFISILFFTRLSAQHVELIKKDNDRDPANTPKSGVHKSISAFIDQRELQLSFFNMDETLNIEIRSTANLIIISETINISADENSWFLDLSTCDQGRYVLIIECGNGEEYYGFFSLE